jgi:hypothetical protein
LHPPAFASVHAASTSFSQRKISTSSEQFGLNQAEREPFDLFSMSPRTWARAFSRHVSQEWILCADRRDAAKDHF